MLNSKLVLLIACNRHTKKDLPQVSSNVRLLANSMGTHLKRNTKHFTHIQHNRHLMLLAN